MSSCGKNGSGILNGIDGHASDPETGVGATRPGRGRSSRGSRSQPLRSPRASRHAPAAAIIAALSVLSRGEATLTRARPASRSRSRVDQRAVAGHPAADHRRGVAERLDRVRRLGDQHVDGRVLERPARCRPCPLASATGSAGRRPHRAKDGGLEAAEREVVAVWARRGRGPGSIGRGKRNRPGRPSRASRSIGRPARIAEAEQLGHLVERLAGGIVERLAQQAVLAPRGHVEQHGVAAAHQQRRRTGARARDPRAWARTGGPRGGSRPGTGRSRLHASVLAYITPTSSAPTSPGPAVTAMPSSCAEADAGVGQRPVDDGAERLHVRPAGQLGHHAAEDPVHVLREDRQGPRARPPAASEPRGTAAEVSSHEVSMPRIHSAIAAPAHQRDAVGHARASSPGGREHPKRGTSRARADRSSPPPPARCRARARPAGSAGPRTRTSTVARSGRTTAARSLGSRTGTRVRVRSPIASTSTRTVTSRRQRPHPPETRGVERERLLDRAVGLATSSGTVRTESMRLDRLARAEQADGARDHRDARSARARSPAGSRTTARTGTTRWKVESSSTATGARLHVLHVHVHAPGKLELAGAELDLHLSAAVVSGRTRVSRIGVAVSRSSSRRGPVDERAHRSLGPHDGAPGRRPHRSGPPARARSRAPRPRRGTRGRPTARAT